MPKCSVKHDGGIVTNSAQETAAAVASILTNNSAVGRRMRVSMAKISMPMPPCAPPKPR